MEPHVLAAAYRYIGNGLKMTGSYSLNRASGIGSSPIGIGFWVMFDGSTFGTDQELFVNSFTHIVKLAGGQIRIYNTLGYYNYYSVLPLLADTLYFISVVDSCLLVNGLLWSVTNGGSGTVYSTFPTGYTLGLSNASNGFTFAAGLKGTVFDLVITAPYPNTAAVNTRHHLALYNNGRGCMPTKISFASSAPLYDYYRFDSIYFDNTNHRFNAVSTKHPSTAFLTMSSVPSGFDINSQMRARITTNVY